MIQKGERTREKDMDGLKYRTTKSNSRFMLSISENRELSESLDDHSTLSTPAWACAEHT